jgi:hypothetical protein
MTTGTVPLCFDCTRLREWPFCEAFPEGIPVEIASWQHDHHTPFPGDNGLSFVAKEDVAGAAHKHAHGHHHHHNDNLAKARRRRPVKGRIVSPPKRDEMLIAENEVELAGELSNFFAEKAVEIAHLVSPALSKAEGDGFTSEQVLEALTRLNNAKQMPEGPERDHAISEARRELANAIAEAMTEAKLGDWTVLLDPLSRTMQAVTESGAHSSLEVAGFKDDRSIVEQVNEDSLRFSTERAGELVGMRYDEAKDEWVPNPNSAWRIDEPVRGMVASDVTTAVEEGWSVDKLAQQLLSSNYAFSDARAVMIARTELNRADNAGNMIGYRASGVVTGKVWLAGNEGADGDACDDCEANAEEGMIDLNEEFGSGDDAPPAHPNCRCAVAPVIAEEEGDGGEQQPADEAEAE